MQNNLKQSEENYKKLNDLYELKTKELKEREAALEKNKEELKISKRYNKKMLIISLVSAAVSVLSLIVTIIFKFI